MVWKSENPNTFAKLMAIQLGATATTQFEYIVTQSGVGQPADLARASRPRRAARCRPHVLVRARYDGHEASSASSRSTTAPPGSRSARATHAAPLTGALKVGPVAFRGSQRRRHRLVRLRPRAARRLDAGHPGRPARPGCSPLSDQFNGTALDPKWALLNPVAGQRADRRRRASDAADHPGRPLRRPRHARRCCCRTSPTGSWVATAKIAHANINRDGEAAGLALINSAQPEPLRSRRRCSTRTTPTRTRPATSRASGRSGC